MLNNYFFLKLLSVFLVPAVCFSGEAETSHPALSITPYEILPSTQTSPNFTHLSESDWNITKKNSSASFSASPSITIPSVTLNFSPKTPSSSQNPTIKHMEVKWSQPNFIQMSFTFYGIQIPEMERELAIIGFLSHPSQSSSQQPTCPSTSFYTTFSSPNLILPIENNLLFLLETLCENNLIPLFFFLKIEPYIKNFFPKGFEFFNNSEIFSSYMKNIPPSSIKSEKDYCGYMDNYLSLLENSENKFSFLKNLLEQISPLVISISSEDPPSLFNAANFPSLSKNDHWVMSLKILQKMLTSSQSFSSFNSTTVDSIYLAISNYLSNSADKFEDSILKEIFIDSPYRNSRNDLIIHHLFKINPSKLNRIIKESPRSYHEVSAILKTVYGDLLPFSEITYENLVNPVKLTNKFIAELKRNQELTKRNEALEQRLAGLTQQLAELNLQNNNPNKRARPEEDEQTSGKKQ
jgi:hypothetical protein